MPFSGETVIVGVSGGADSVSLLLAIDDLRRREKLDLRIVVGHFDHRLRGEASGADLAFVRELTVARKLELAAGEWKHSPGGNLEQSARDARYGFLLETAEKLRARFVLTGHTMNDQAETVLINLIRGSGIDGLGGMKPIRDLGSETDENSPFSAENDPLLPFPSPVISLARPLLTWAKRRDTEGFCREHEVDFRTDPMNEDLTFNRVWVRKVLLPMIEEMNPKIVDTLCRTAELLQERPEPGAEVGEAEKGRRRGGEKTPKGDEQLKIRNLRLLPKNDLYTQIRFWLKTNRGNSRGLQLKHIAAIGRLVNSPKSGRVAELPGGDSVVKSGGRLAFRHNKLEN